MEELLIDAYGDDEQLWALHAGIEDSLDLPMDVHVIGEPLTLIAIDYDGNARRGLVASCRGADGTEHRVAFADIQLAPDAAGYPYLVAYCRWLGVQPASPRPRRDSGREARDLTAGEEDIDPAKPMDLIVVAVKQRAARCRFIGSERVITLRAASLDGMVPGQVVTVQANKHWRFNGHPYLSGKITSNRIDAPALGLTPLALNEFGAWDPADAYGGEADESIEHWARPMIARGPRPVFEMAQVLPGHNPDDFDSDPILEANDLNGAGDTEAAQDILTQLLESDLRCLDAHAHLGNLLFQTSPEWAINHYEVGVRIGELSLGPDFDGVLAWSLIDNRPFLRCMQGYGLCLWRLQRWEEAEHVFERILLMNPLDNQGIRFLLPAVRGHEAWVDDED
ncbi:cytoplasmic protein [Ectothiorhodospira shaposhnikovii]|uniref:cytoplasmic protein n=1 Tax=Ectothiorhodospira shaposhnikovii TaxID=1054 RepID=UPI001F5B8B60|nr:cytoplasmic protein [Ectothiorhodospira shaposhnikovii]